MPKIKTKKAAAKRFKITASGKIKRARANVEHILTKMSRKHKNRLKSGGYVQLIRRTYLNACEMDNFLD